MSSSSFGKHASGATSGQSAVPEPSFAERARTLMHSDRIGSLSTLSRKQPGFPFGSLMPYALDAQGRPIFLVSTMAMHTQNLQADPRASLFVTEPGASGDLLGSSRVTLIGSVIRILEPDLAAARTEYLTRYPDSKYWVDFDDFLFYRMDVLDVYYVGGFGVMGWVAAFGLLPGAIRSAVRTQERHHAAHECRPQRCAHSARQTVLLALRRRKQR